MTLLNKAGPTSQQTSFFVKKLTQSTIGGVVPWPCLGYSRGCGLRSVPTETAI